MADEEEKPAEEKPTVKTEEEEKKEEEGEKSPDSNSMIDAAEDAAARLERANAKKEKLLDREESMRVKDALGGKAEAGTPKETSDTDYAKKVMEGENPDGK